MTYKKKL